jgi:hypothetical protein
MTELRAPFHAQLALALAAWLAQKPHALLLLLGGGGGGAP